MNVELQFNGLFLASEFITKSLKDRHGRPRFTPSVKLPEGADQPGVYIWGFMIKNKFIPYYVGKIHSSVRSRIQSHVTDIIKEQSTYTRLSSSYIEGNDGIIPFYNDDNFFMQTANYPKVKLPHWYTADKNYFRNRIVYLNNREFVSSCTGTDIPVAKDYPISLMGAIDDYLLDNIEQLHVAFAAYRLQAGYMVDLNEFYETLEAFTKFSLKGRTSGKSLSIDKMNHMLVKYGMNIDLTWKNMNIFKNSPSMVFPSY